MLMDAAAPRLCAVAFRCFCSVRSMETRCFGLQRGRDVAPALAPAPRRQPQPSKDGHHIPSACTKGFPSPPSCLNFSH